MAHLDELDTALLRELQRDARRTNRDLAAAVGVAPTTALDRTRSLRQRGVIRGALLDVDLAAIGRPVQALIAVRIRPPSRRNIEAFRDWAARLPDIVGVFVVSGSEASCSTSRWRKPAALRFRHRQAHRASRGGRRPDQRHLRAPAQPRGRPRRRALTRRPP
jgi:DNA-binding Lrp family transcriptional regulator